MTYKIKPYIGGEGCGVKYLFFQCCIPFFDLDELSFKSAKNHFQITIHQNLPTLKAINTQRKIKAYK